MVSRELTGTGCDFNFIMVEVSGAQKRFGPTVAALTSGRERQLRPATAPSLIRSIKLTDDTTAVVENAAGIAASQPTLDAAAPSPTASQQLEGTSSTHSMESAAR